jgi:DUF4097 and DUF4098 domain-containing protein YvlB
MKKLFVSALFIVVGFAQDADRLTVPFSDASRPKTLRVDLVNGSISVKGYEGKDVIVEARPRGARSPEPETTGGLRRIPIHGTGLEAEEQDNVIRIKASSLGRNIDVAVQVPIATSLKLKTVNGGKLEVERVDGDIEVSNTNGSVDLTNVSGSVVAHSLNGPVNVTFDKVRPDKPMSFSTLNGNIEVAFPSDIRAKVKLKSDNGDVYSDFEVKLEPASKTVVEEGAPGKGKYKVRVDRAVYGTINGGGPEMTFTTLNGKIVIRRK